MSCKFFNGWIIFITVSGEFDSARYLLKVSIDGIFFCCWSLSISMESLVNLARNWLGDVSWECSPKSMEKDVTDSQIAAIKGLNTQLVFIYKKMLSNARTAGICDSWVAAFEKCIKQNENILNRRRGLWQKTRKTVALRTRLRRLLAVGTQWETFEHTAV